VEDLVMTNGGRNITRVAAATLAALLGFGLTACVSKLGGTAQPAPGFSVPSSGSSATETGSVSPTESSDSASASATASSAATATITRPRLTGIPDFNSNGLPSGVPAGFPVPPGAKLTGTTDPEGNSAILINGLKAGDVAQFYKTELPKAGYTVTDYQSVNSGGQTFVSMEFNGKGFNGTLGAAPSALGDTVAIELKKAR
jgi:hypothetical protein